MGTIQKRTLVVAACAAFATVTACGSSSDNEGGSASAKATATATNSPAARSTPAASASASARRLDAAVRAVKTAQRKVSRGKAYDIESDRRRGKRVWEVKVVRGVARGHKLDVRFDGRKVVGQRRRSKVDDDVRKLAKAKVTLAKALRTAGRRAEGGTFDEAEIDRSRGRIVWEATFDKPGDREVEVTVDARTGKVTRVTHDD
ncbi:MAG TPA: PepSY domain-containing protein [Solirubrobacter sp.]|jgi:uncharacterized membrane protein YkoI|nr:PepSY domain-containing protein [Solirubrobacter sp.]